MIDIDQERFIAEYRSHRHEYPEFIQVNQERKETRVPRKGSIVTQVRVKERPVRAMVRSI